MREKVIENYLTARVKAHGGEVRKVQWIGRRAAPDKLVLLNGKHPLVELKRPKGKPEPHQAREHKRLRAAGFDVRVIDTIQGVDDFIRELTA